MLNIEQGYLDRYRAAVAFRLGGRALAIRFSEGI
jgi:hypothetical protein